MPELDRYHSFVFTDAMTVAQAAGWGLLGGFIVEALEYAAAIRRTGGFPFARAGEPGLLASLVAIVLRLAAGAGLAAAAGASGQVAGPFGAVALGITAPLLVEKILHQAAMEATITNAKPVTAKPPVRPVTSTPARRSRARISQGQLPEGELSDAD